MTPNQATAQRRTPAARSCGDVSGPSSMTRKAAATATPGHGSRDIMPSPTPTVATIVVMRTPRSSGNAIAAYSAAPIATTSRMNAANRVGRDCTTNHSAGIATAAVASLVRSTQALDLGRGPAEAALAPLEVIQCLQVLPLAEVGPQRVGDVQLAVGDLPEIEVADAHLAAGADQQVRVGDAGG